MFQENTNNLQDWQDETFRRCYEEEAAFLRRQVDNGKLSCSDLEATLNSLYISDDNNLEGRSLVMQLSLSASIAAYEAVIASLKENR